MQRHPRISGGLLIMCLLLGLAAPALAVTGVRVVLARSSGAAAAVALGTATPRTTPSTTPSTIRPRSARAADELVYRVQRGDNLTAIASRLHVRGGWHALYIANRRTVGANPDLLHAGEVLTISGNVTRTDALSGRYVVVGTAETARAIAAQHHLAGGWRTLHTANPLVITSGSQVLPAGLVLRLPTTRAPQGVYAGHAAHQDRRPFVWRRPAALPAMPAPSRADTTAAPATPQGYGTKAAFPGWLRIVLIGAAATSSLAVAVDALRRVGRRRRPAPSERTPPEPVRQQATAPSARARTGAR